MVSVKPKIDKNITINIKHNAGGSTSTGKLNDVLEFSAEDQAWTKIGETSLKMRDHAVSVINFNSIKDYCN